MRIGILESEADIQMPAAMHMGPVTRIGLTRAFIFFKIYGRCSVSHHRDFPEVTDRRLSRD